ncbi:hypothetical protein PENTCL1PPCAC_5502, partial [Pristionchus entomophagus]
LHSTEMLALLCFLPLIYSLELETTTFQSYSGSTLVPLDGQVDLNGTLHCPNIGNAISTKTQETAAYYYECCGVGSMYTCIKFKTWFIITFSIALLIAILLLIAICVRYFREDKDDV